MWSPGTSFPRGPSDFNRSSCPCHSRAVNSWVRQGSCLEGGSFYARDPPRCRTLSRCRGALILVLLTEILIVVFLTLLNGVLAMSELAVVSSRAARLRVLSEQGNAGAAVAIRLAENPGRFLSTVQIGITLVGVLSGGGLGAPRGGPGGGWGGFKGFFVWGTRI